MTSQENTNETNAPTPTRERRLHGRFALNLKRGIATAVVSTAAIIASTTLLGPIAAAITAAGFAAAILAGFAVLQRFSVNRLLTVTALTTAASMTTITLFPTLGLPFTIAGFVTVAACLFATQERISRAKREMRVPLERLANGIVAFRSDGHHHGELGEHLDHYDTGVTKLTEIISKLINVTEEMMGSSSSMNSSVNEVADEMSSQSRELESMGTKAQHIVNETNAARSVVTDVAQSAQTATDAVSGGVEIISNATDQMEQVNVATNRINEEVQVVSRQCGEITELVTMIDEISEQTNLLALNAAIEAARAGENGRGFAVVADEVRKLADRTTESTQRIRDSIREITEGITSASDNMSQTAERVGSGLELISQAQQALGSIASAVENASSGFRHVGDKLDAVNATTTEFWNGVEFMSSSSQMAAATADETRGQVAQTGQLISTAQEVVNQIKLGH